MVQITGWNEDEIADANAEMSDWFLQYAALQHAVAAKATKPKGGRP